MNKRGKDLSSDTHISSLAHFLTTITDPKRSQRERLLELSVVMDEMIKGPVVWTNYLNQIIVENSKLCPIKSVQTNKNSSQCNGCQCNSIYL